MESETFKFDRTPNELDLSYLILQDKVICRFIEHIRKLILSIPSVKEFGRRVNSNELYFISDEILNHDKILDSIVDAPLNLSIERKDSVYVITLTEK